LKKYKVKCPNCTSILELTEEDGKLMVNGYKVGVSIACPVCSAKIVATIGTIFDELIPDLMPEDVDSEERCPAGLTSQDQLDGKCPPDCEFHE